WAGCLGMVIGMWVYLQRNDLNGVMVASVVAGIIGGLGFSTGILLKLVEMTSGLETNWHSIMEQTYGAINGLAIAAAMALLIRRAPAPPEDDSPQRAWSLPPIVFTLLIIPYLNLQKNPEEWVKKKAMPESMYRIPAQLWFD